MSSIRFIACLYLISIFGNCHEDPYYQPFDKLNITLDIYTYEDLVPYTVDNDLPNPNDDTTSFVKIYFKNFWITVMTKWCAPFIDTVSVYTSHDNLNIQFYSRDEYDTQSEDKICTIDVKARCKHLTKREVTVQQEAYRYSLSSDLSCFDSIDLDIDLIETNSTDTTVLKSYELMLPKRAKSIHN
ncbi:CPXV028 protein [Cowpox virus]|uniref:CPXV028 protein n=1 Tax=Cowpox virus TaxID=10243 RepID=A0A1B5FLE3_COWPX|nr:CPXV028 protein [Cowpox virus]SNB49853.1 CPXV028 protein [Cowpox virus]SNB65923.1 CPXV028 protein [Cowpox virus]SPN68109.1 CPXV028 protein [Cowpox virus]SPN68388.1 CPXV028 protein [Cowpox virus]